MYTYKPGDRIQIKHYPYKVCEVHEGGMGVVYLCKSARPTNSQTYPEYLSAKLFKAELPLDSLLNELNIWLSLNHPNILPLNSIGVVDFQTAAFSNWRIYGSLYGLLENCGRLPTEMMKEILLDCTAALNYAWHEKQVLHLDIKPQNLLLSSLPWKAVQVADWGIARLAADIHISRARQNLGDARVIASSFSGTLPYMAPERFLESYVPTISADVFSLGMMTLQCLTGLLPFRTSRTSFIEQVLSGEYFHHTKEMTVKFPRQWRTFVRRCVAFDQVDRFTSYAALRNEIYKLEVT